jgi:outer membrane receptor protein involved in Fe transport
MYDNCDEAHMRGAELSIDGAWNGLRVQAHASRQRAVDGSGAELVNAPRRLAGLSALVPLPGARAYLGLETIVVGERRLLDGSTLPMQSITNAAVTLPAVVDRLDLTLGLTNLFDQRDDSPGGLDHRQAAIPGDPRTVWLRLSIDLGRVP